MQLRAVAVVLALNVLACSELAGLDAYGEARGGASAVGGAGTGGTTTGVGGMTNGAGGTLQTGCLLGAEVVRDDFERRDQDGWGVPSGETAAWVPSEPTRVRIDAGRGILDMEGATTESATWAVSLANVEVVATIIYQVPADGFDLALGSVLVRDAGPVFWEARIELDEGSLPVLRVMPAGMPEFFGAVPLTGVSGSYRLRFVVTGVDPITVRAKVWPPEEPEPDRWDVDETAPANMGNEAGTVIAAGYVQGPDTPLLVRFDDFVICSLP